jgi:uncharacterized membrane protein YqjE
LININKIKYQLRQYIDARVDLSKFQIKEQVASSLSSFLMIFLAMGISFFLLLFLSLAAGVYINDKLESKFIGFLIVAGFYLIAGILVLINRKRIISMIIYRLYVEPEVEEKLKHEE